MTKLDELKAKRTELNKEIYRLEQQEKYITVGAIRFDGKYIQINTSMWPNSKNRWSIIHFDSDEEPLDNLKKFAFDVSELCGIAERRYKGEI